VLCLVFAACFWSGRLFDAHYADRAEFFAVALVGVSVVGPLLLGAGSATVWGLPTRVLLALATGRTPGGWSGSTRSAPSGCLTP
jgi:hypothetical protein